MQLNIECGSKKFIQKIISESGITDNVHIQMDLPRIGFELS